MIVCPECSNPGNDGYLFCPDDGSRLMELDDTLLEPGSRVDVHRVGKGTIVAASGDDYLDPAVLCYAIDLDRELNGETRHWFLKRTGVDTLKDWSLIEGQPLPSGILPQKRYFAAHCEVVPITEYEPHRTCPACGKGFDATTSYCSVDGTRLTATTVAGRLEKVAPVRIGKTPPKKEVPPFQDLLTEIDKKNKAHWIKKFSGFVEGKYNFGWNWPSFFFGPLRYCLKGMWLKGILYRLGAGIIQVFLISTFGWEVFFQSWLATAIFFGMMGANDYYLFCSRYREDLKVAKKQKATGIVLICLSPLLVPILMSVIRFLF